MKLLYLDDANILAWGHSTKETCRILRKVHDRCLTWAKEHGARFAPEKYELVHFTRKKKFQTDRQLDLGTHTIPPTGSVRVLGLHLDSRMNWSAHRRHLEEKMRTQENALHRLSASTWGLPFLQARQVYTTVIRPALTYASHIWHRPGPKSPAILRTARSIQNRNLRTVCGAFKATPIRSLETLAHVPPIDLYLDGRTAAFQGRLTREVRDMESRINTRIARTLGGGTPQATSNHRWADQDGKSVNRKVYQAWEDRWKETRGSRAEILELPPDKKRLTLHKSLHKAESSILTQILTGKIGLAAFLYRRKVPGVESPNCACGWAEESPKHVLLHCPRYADRRRQLMNQGRLDLEWLLKDEEGVRRVTRWWLKVGVCDQFRLAKTLILDCV